MEGLIDDDLCEMEQVCVGFFEVNSGLSYSKTAREIHISRDAGTFARAGKVN
jgi:hypothetical protein